MIIRRRSKHDRKYVVGVTRVKVEPLSASDLVSELKGLDIKVWNLLDRCDFKAMHLLADLKIVWHTILTPWYVKSQLMRFTPSLHHFSRCCLLLLHSRDFTLGNGGHEYRLLRNHAHRRSAEPIDSCISG